MNKFSFIRSLLEDEDYQSDDNGSEENESNDNQSDSGLSDEVAQDVVKYVVSRFSLLADAHTDELPFENGLEPKTDPDSLQKHLAFFNSIKDKVSKTFNLEVGDWDISDNTQELENALTKVLDYYGANISDLLTDFKDFNDESSSISERTAKEAGIC